MLPHHQVLLSPDLTASGVTLILALPSEQHCQGLLCFHRRQPQLDPLDGIPAFR